MSQSVPITKAALKAQASILRNHEHLLALELAGKEPEARYQLVFSRLLRPDPFRLFGMGMGPDTPFTLGTDQRDQIVPRLAERLMPLRPGAVVLDVGAGDGQTTAYALEGRLQPLTFLPVDIAEGALARYRDLFASRFPQLKVGRSLAAGIDEMVTATPGSPAFLEERVDMVMVIHAIYFTADVARFLRFAHDRLLPGGKLVIAFGVDNGRYSGGLAQAYRKLHPAAGEEPPHATGDELDRFFGLETGELPEGESRRACEERLGARLGGRLFRVAEVIRQPTRLYAHDFGDLLAMGFITGLVPQDDEELLHQIAFVSERLQQEPERFDLRLTLTGPRARMLSVAQPQIVLGLEKA